MKRCYLVIKYIIIDRNKEMGEIESDNEEDLEHQNDFQRVYVEDLGKEMFMDTNGNLYDMDNNFVGQAEEG